MGIRGASATPRGAAHDDERKQKVKTTNLLKAAVATLVAGGHGHGRRRLRDGRHHARRRVEARRGRPPDADRLRERGHQQPHAEGRAARLLLVRADRRHEHHRLRPGRRRQGRRHRRRADQGEDRHQQARQHQHRLRLQRVQPDGVGRAEPARLHEQPMGRQAPRLPRPAEARGRRHRRQGHRVRQGRRRQAHDRIRPSRRVRGHRRHHGRPGVHHHVQRHRHRRQDRDEERRQDLQPRRGGLQGARHHRHQEDHLRPERHRRERRRQRGDGHRQEGRLPDDQHRAELDRLRPLLLRHQRHVLRRPDL